MQEKKENRFVPRLPKWLLFVPLGLLAVYVTIQLVAVLDNRYETETAIQDTLTDSVQLDGVLLFAQQPVDGEGSLGYLVEEGERVSAGTAVAEIYTSSEQASLRNQLTALQNRIALLEKSESVGTDIGVLLNQEQNAENDLLEALDRKDYENLNSRQESYLLAANKLQVTTGRVANFDAQLAELNAQAESLTQQLGTPQTIPAPVGGYFVQAQEARMLTVEADALNNASPAELREMLDQGADESLEGKAGKIVTSYQWDFYGVCPKEEGERISQKVEQGGRRIQISFLGRAETALPATIQEVTQDEDSGLAKIVVHCEYMSAQILALGQQTARLDLNSYTGLRISKDAVHIVDDVNGVYVRSGQLIEFRPIVKLYENENYILVPNGGSKESQLKLYDEVVVRGRGLRDGRLA